MDDIEDILRKLTPVIGKKKADSLWRLCLIGGPNKAYAEAHIRLLGEQELGRNYSKDAFLLEPPSEADAGGDYYLGNIIYGERELHPFFLREAELLEHTAIFGRSGSGKTNVAYMLLDSLIQIKKPFLVFDWKRNYRDLIPRSPDLIVYTIGRDVAPFAFNPLVPPPGTSKETWLKKLIEIICNAYFLGEGVAYLLLRAMDDSPATMTDVLNWLVKHKAKGREGMWLDSAKRTMASLCYGSFGDAISGEKGMDISALLEKQVIFELDSLSNADKSFFIQSLLLWIHHYRMAQPTREHLAHLIFIEEAHHILLRRMDGKGDETITDVIMREIRELGEGVVIIDQHPSMISKPALANTYTTIALNCKHMADVRGVGDAMALPEEDQEHLTRLPVGMGVVRLQGRWPKPFLVSFPKYPILKGKITDSDIAGQMQGYSADPGNLATIRTEREVILPPLLPEERRNERGKFALGQEEMALLQDAARMPFSSMVERYTRLRMNAYQGNRAKGELIAKGMARIEEINTGKGRGKFLVLTDEGIDQVEANGMKVNRLNGNESFEHQYWKERLAGEARELGWDVAKEKKMPNGKEVDLVLTRGERRIAIQVETGKSTVEENVIGLQGCGFEKILILWTNHLSSWHETIDYITSYII